MSDKPVVQKVIVAGIVTHKGKILIVQRSSDEDVFPNLWELPSGKREPFEKSQDGLVREVKEETGLDVEIVRPVDVFEFRVEKESEIRDATQISFLVKPLGVPKVKLSSEHQNYSWITRSEINKYNISEKTKGVILKAFELKGLAD
jgi:8-oxo-dGTP diphosphatase